MRLHPGSALIDIKHEWVVFDKFMNSGSRQYLQSITTIKPESDIRGTSAAIREDISRPGSREGSFRNLEHPHRDSDWRDPFASIEHEGVALGKFMHTGSRQYLQTVTEIKTEWIIDLPYFRNEKLARKGNGALRQPHVKESLERWQIPDGLTMKDWKIRCITNFDLHERRLTDTDNNDELIAVARRRITHCAKQISSDRRSESPPPASQTAPRSERKRGNQVLKAIAILFRMPFPPPFNSVVMGYGDAHDDLLRDDSPYDTTTTEGYASRT
ncbi:hypothetical protein CDV31_002900 [Fusarium ambrosium]|uniref:Uncharacterized protein n=1 Tax=Fusarium ambrosium TaxID=131363 RepID=A0A428UV63_9HYPO|nr:hypothetical protein CDV31_002900 [Fusarium ambrosium]